MQGAFENVYKRLWYALINFPRFRSIVPPKLKVDRIQIGRFWCCLAQEWLGCSNPHSHSSAMSSTNNPLSSAIRDV